MRHITALAVLLMLIVPAFAQSAGDSVAARELMARVNENLNPDDEVNEASLLLIHPNGQQRRWKIKQYYQRAQENGMGAVLLRFLEPPDLRGTTLISVNQPEGENYQWMYLPAFKIPRFLNDSSKADYVFGSDLTFEDYIPHVIDDYSYEWLREETLDGRHSAVIKIKPVAPKLLERVTYAHQTVWIDPDRLVILRMDFVDARGRLFKTSTWADFYQPDGQHWRARRRIVFSPLRPHWTEMNIQDVRVNKGLPPDFFSEHNLATIR